LEKHKKCADKKTCGLGCMKIRKQVRELKSLDYKKQVEKAVKIRVEFNFALKLLINAMNCVILLLNIISLNLTFIILLSFRC